MKYRIDDIGFGHIRLKQDLDGFCYGVDSVILADFVSKFLKGGEKIMDLGTGNAVVPMILSQKRPDIDIFGIELQKGVYNLALENVELNKLKDRITIIHSDVRREISYLDEKFDVVCSNPPYFKKGSGVLNDMTSRMIARHETTAGLREFFDAAFRMLKLNGIFVMIHRPDRLVDIISYARGVGIEPKEIRFIKPYRNKPANLVLLMMKKGAGSELKVNTELIVREYDGNYTDEINLIYGRKALPKWYSNC